MILAPSVLNSPRMGSRLSGPPGSATGTSVNEITGAFGTGRHAVVSSGSATKVRATNNNLSYFMIRSQK